MRRGTVLVTSVMKKTLIALALGVSILPATLQARPMTATDLATMRQIGAPAVSPDGRYLAYQLSETDLAANKRRTDLFVVDLKSPKTAPMRLLTAPDTNESAPAF